MRESVRECRRKTYNRAVDIHVRGLLREWRDGQLVIFYAGAYYRQWVEEVQIQPNFTSLCACATIRSGFPLSLRAPHGQ